MNGHKIIEPVKWDSDFFGMKIGKTRLDGKFDRLGFTGELDKGQFDLIYGTSNTGQPVSGCWERLGFYFVDCMITLSMDFDAKRYGHLNYERCDNLLKEDINACYAISEAVAPVSRFYRERAIGEELTKKLYRKWVDTALDGTFSDCLLVERVKGRVAGINAVRTEKDAGVCTLIGVDKEFRGKGIGRKLWDQAFAYWALNARGIGSVKVKFSAGNASAFGFYIAMGFDKVDKVDYIYHYSKSGQRPAKIS